jgi:chromosome segregation protein
MYDRGSAVLKLKKVELLGFKSFCEKTEMRFNGGGIAAIVGPNGCGKSNLSDAISWVLGEQSAKLLRGTRMEDVIFNGTRDRKPLGMASVSLTLIDPEVFFYGADEVLDHTDGRKGQKPGEIVVERRLFRSGESEYVLNGKTCRLRDIQDIFMGTGLGPESYAIIEQGRIGQILSSRPHDRRAVVEEAAGITKFKTRKKLAEAKLESARQNLARVADILEEVGRQCNSLKRQATKARRYEELRQEMTARLTVLLGSRHRDLERQAVQAALDLNLAGEEFRRQNAAVGALDAEHAATQKESHELERRLEERREACSQAAIDTDRARQKMEYQARLAEENATRIQQAEGEVAAIERRLAELVRELEAERAAAEAVGVEGVAAREELAAKTDHLEELQTRVRQREVEQESLRHSILRLLGEASTLRNQLAQIEEFLAGLERQFQRAGAEEAEAQQEIEQLGGERRAALARLEQQQMEIESLDRRRQRVEASLAESRQQAQTRRERVEGLRGEISRLEARRESLQEILSHRAYTTDTVKNLFAAIEQGRMGDFRAKGILADFIEVDPNYEKAVEDFLRDELEYVVVESWAEAERGMRLLRAETEGHATFLIHPDGEPPEEPPAIGPETGILGRLKNHVRLTNGLGRSAAALLPRLNCCYLAESEDAARRLSFQYPELYFLLPDGVCYHGYSLSGGRKSSSGPLALKRELREMAPRLAAAEESLAVEALALTRAEESINVESAELDTLRAEVLSREKTAVASEQELKQINERLNRAGSRLSVARLERERLKQERDRAAEEQERSRAAVEQREAARREAEQSLEATREAIAEHQARAARAAEEQSQLRARLAALEERSKAAQTAAARVEQMLAAETSRRDEIAHQAAAWAAERDRLIADNQQLAVQIAELTTRQARLDQEARDLDATLQARRARMAEIEETLQTAKQDLEAARERRSAIEIELVRLQSDLKHLEETCLRELGRPIGELSSGDEAPLSADDLAAVEQDYLQVKQKIEALGPVNVLALEEYQEAQQRFDFLEAQRKDLVDSIQDTQQAISEIDSVSRKQFLEAFEEINRNFRQTFATLFGGGVGEMRLSDETNIAESGVDIVAQPPGKRLQNVLLLSGGEKALTAIALLMAVFQYQPSPFCILDEVDAPLDEANVVRFTRLIQQMSEQTQFILITHNRTTMEVAQTLYGVTMQEPGVSRLVSVKFEATAKPNGRPLVPSPAPVGNLARA